MRATLGQRWRERDKIRFGRIPWCLVALRVLLAPVAILVVWAELPRWVWLLQFAIAIISDIYDGKLARRWGVVTPGLRQADSIADTIYAIGAFASFWLAEPEIISDHVWGIVLVAGLELARYPLDWLRFGRGASYHAHSARLFGLSLIPVGVLLMCFGIGWPFLWIALAVGLYSELEGIAMSLVLPRWTRDVRHLGIALAIRRAAQADGQGE